MVSLKGIVYQSGHIDFPREENAWAFKRMEAEMKRGQENRVVVKPELAPIELERSENVAAAEVPWITRVESLLNTADRVYFQRKEAALRFRQAIHEINQNCRLVTVGAEVGIDEFASQHWNRIAYFFALRHDGFRFDLGTLITLKDSAADKSNRMELFARLVDVEDNANPQVTFDATGSNAHVELVEWRKSVKEGETGRFLLPETQIELKFSQARQPLTFYHEFREDRQNHAYMFNGEKLETRLKRVLNRPRAVPDQSE